MNEAYLFRIGPLCFILNVQQSSIGYSYPRIFISYPDRSYLNVDLTLGACFAMTEKDWLSWLDGSEYHLTDIDEVKNLFIKCGINYEAFEEWAFKSYDEAAK